MRCKIFFIVVAGGAFAAGCSQVETRDAAAGPMNARCPIMGHEIDTAGGSTAWQGQTIGFCCDGCLPKWNELADEEKAAKLAAASKTTPEHAEHGS